MVVLSLHWSFSKPHKFYHPGDWNTSSMPHKLTAVLLAVCWHAWSLVASDSGYMTAAIGIQWMNMDVHWYTGQTSDSTEWIMLFLDGHSSHNTMELILSAEAHKTLVASYPPHRYHLLQSEHLVDTFLNFFSFFSLISARCYWPWHLETWSLKRACWGCPSG